MPLTTKTLQHKLAIYPCTLTQALAGKSITHPLGLMPLHPQLNPHITFLVHFIKVQLALHIRRLLHGLFLYFAPLYIQTDIGVRNLGNKHLYRVTYPEEIRQGKYHHVKTEQHGGIIKGRIKIQHNRQGQSCGICYQ